jgi:HSP20 family protein
MAKDYYSVFDDLQKDMKRFLKHLKDRQRIPADFLIDVWSPNVNICEGDKNYFVLIEIPGADPKVMKIIVHGDRLHISGNRYPEVSASGTKCLHMEIISGAFKRSIQLPEQVNSENVQAKYHNGILQITLEKLPQEAVDREIPITTETHGEAK